MRPSKNVSYRVEQQNKKCIQIMILIAKDPRQDGLKKKSSSFVVQYPGILRSNQI